MTIVESLEMARTGSNKSSKESVADINRKLSAKEKINLYTLMVRIRRFEERAIRSYQQGKIGGFCHTYIGQEALAVGSISVLEADDHIITAYRDHGHALAVGMGMNELMAELYGKVTGCSRGKGGSMHYFDPKKNFWGGHGIVSAQTPLGAGIAFALKYRGKRSACLCYLGDGAVNQGALFEALNLASLWNLPVIYIIENNQYSMGTSQERSSAGKPLAKRGESFDIEWAEVKGCDLYEVREKTHEALEKARTKSRPSILEMDTYRYRGHSMSDPDQTYRTKGEIDDYRKQLDPIMLMEGRLKVEGILDEEKVKAIDQAVHEEVEACVKYADDGPFPPISDIQTNVYWEEDNPEHKKSKGTMFFN